LHLIPQPLVFARTLHSHPLRLAAHLCKALPRLCNHGPQPFMLFSSYGELSRDRLEFVMKIARRRPQFINLPMQAFDAPSQDEKRYQGRGQDQR
jgi:hypothetical protein